MIAFPKEMTISQMLSELRGYFNHVRDLIQFHINWDVNPGDEIISSKVDNSKWNGEAIGQLFCSPNMSTAV